MATKKSAAKPAAKPKAEKPKAAPAPKVEQAKPEEAKPQVEEAPKVEQTEASTRGMERRGPDRRADSKPELGPIDGVLVNVLWADDKYVVTNISNRPVVVRECAPKGYYATTLQTITLAPGETYNFVRRDQVTLKPSTI